MTNVITITQNPITDEKRLTSNRKGIVAIEKIWGKGEIYAFQTEKIEGFNYQIDNSKNGILIEVVFKEKILSKTGSEIYKKNIYFVNFKNDTIKEMKFLEVKELVESPEMEMYR